jgi:hypothetical protein
MTHFTVAIIVPDDELGRVEAFVTEQMAPYDEDIQVAPYVCYSVAQAKADIERDTKRLKQIVSREEPGYDLGRCRQALKELMATTPEAKYRERLKYHERFNSRGEPVSTYNPSSKWDWYVIGGRWAGWISDRETASERVDDNIATTEQALERNKIPHAILTPDGEWHERGIMGWWAILVTENEGWDDEAREILRRFPGHHVVIVDAHI